MPTVTELIGGLVDRWVGQRTTRVYKDSSISEIHHLKSDLYGTEFQSTIISKRIVYLTVYRHWWIPNKRHVIYEVVCEADDDVREKLPAIYFQPMVYPLLCTRLLMRTPYPHRYAIVAFLNEIPHRTEVTDFQV